MTGSGDLLVTHPPDGDRLDVMKENERISTTPTELPFL